jgi:hypothetical protein
MDRQKQWIGQSPIGQKGVKGFQPIGLENKKDLRQIVRLSHRQMRVINQFSKEMGLSKADLFRIALFEYLNNHNVNTDGEPIIDKDQMTLFENE